MNHTENCMCDSCIKARVIKRIEAEAEAERQREFERNSQAYIRRRGGIDPRGNPK